jgi:hypothetical protein
MRRRLSLKSRSLAFSRKTLVLMSARTPVRHTDCWYPVVSRVLT